MRIVIVSATSVIARACIDEWASKGSHDFVLVGRNLERLEQVANDLGTRYTDSTFSVQVTDLESVTALKDLGKKLIAKPIDQVLIAQGSLSDQKLVKSDIGYLEDQLRLNAVSAALCTELFANILELQGFGNLGVIGSVASDRGRAYNYSYGAAKALLAIYAEGLWQRFAGSKVSVSLIQPGPTATPMTAEHSGKMSDPKRVAKVIVSGLKAKRRRIYAPKIWRYIMLIVSLIPFAIFKRLKF